ncbi:hypothetical protein MD588_18915 [Photobacterium sp. SDRW27]|uniref:hypothetical protein n=1 Tax=Photobacterium obscurum TaxID=2829490 RepID=UPI002243F242|nr:hypothetical protein [Photobacterium obscurum]MCW8330868.1 hypothetical protein [Photobacterium obscurum]
MPIVAAIIIIIALCILGPHLKNIIAAILSLIAIYYIGSVGLALLGGAIGLGPIIVGLVVFFFIRGIFFE